jgi:uncharacterized membrane protein YhaH (DUF805 family)
MENSEPAPEGRARRLLRLLFGFELPVGRALYAAAGFSLMGLKYLFDAWLIGRVSDQPWMPWDYLSPLVKSRLDFVQHAQNSEVLLGILAASTLPFLWIGVSMTVRRAKDAGLPPELGLLFFVPLVNYLTMLVLCFLPSRPAAGLGGAASPYGARPRPGKGAFLESALLGALVGAAFAAGMVLVSVTLLERYGNALFVGSPFVVGAAAAYVLERRVPTTFGQSQLVAQAALALSGLAFLLFALEGVICLLMAWPIAALMAVPGAWLGRQIGRLPPRRFATVSPLWILAVAWPLLMASEPRPAPPELRAVSTRIVIQAPAEKVWQNVIDFPELPPPSKLIFALGVAYPQRARLEGRGVGAVRYCEFSTGPFVEPITAWDPPRRLAFDVASQPYPLREISPYRVVDAPHLDGFLQSRRGEFLLRPTVDGGTEVIGTTWYEVHIFPQAYWQLYADAIIHAIHERVLEHVAATTLAGSPPS